MYKKLKLTQDQIHDTIGTIHINMPFYLCKFTAMTERKGTFKVEFLKNIETECQKNWDKLRIFEEDAPDDGSKGTPEEK